MDILDGQITDYQNCTITKFTFDPHSMLVVFRNKSSNQDTPFRPKTIHICTSMQFCTMSPHNVLQLKAKKNEFGTIWSGVISSLTNDC